MRYTRYIILAASALVLFQLFSCIVPQTATRAYKLTITAEVDGKPKQGSGVFELRYRRGAGGKDGGHTVLPVTGTTPIVDLDGLGWIICCSWLLPKPSAADPITYLSLTNLPMLNLSSTSWPPSKVGKREFVGSKYSPTLGLVSSDGSQVYSLMLRKLENITGGRAKITSMFLEDAEPLDSYVQSKPPSWLIELRKGASLLVETSSSNQYDPKLLGQGAFEAARSAK
jgi:hypothetical protein